MMAEKDEFDRTHVFWRQTQKMEKNSFPLIKIKILGGG